MIVVVSWLQNLTLHPVVPTYGLILSVNLTNTPLLDGQNSPYKSLLPPPSSCLSLSENQYPSSAFY